MTANQIAFYRAREEKRANLAREQETQRANKERENIDKANSRLSANHMLRQDSETQRSNVARETETNRANIAREQEDYRSHRNSEAINAMNARSNASQAATAAGHLALNATMLPYEQGYKEAQTQKTQKESDVVYMNAFNSKNNIFGLWPSNKSRSIGSIDWSKVSRSLKGYTYSK